MTCKMRKMASIAPPPVLREPPRLERRYYSPELDDTVVIAAENVRPRGGESVVYFLDDGSIAAERWEPRERWLLRNCDLSVYEDGDAEARLDVTDEISRSGSVVFTAFVNKPFSKDVNLTARKYLGWMVVTYDALLPPYLRTKLYAMCVLPGNDFPSIATMLLMHYEKVVLDPFRVRGPTRNYHIPWERPPWAYADVPFLGSLVSFFLEAGWVFNDPSLAARVNDQDRPETVRMHRELRAGLRRPR